MRTTLNIKHNSPADLAKALRSAAAKIDAQSITPGADVTVGNVRVQVAESNVSAKRIWLAENGFTVGSRGRFSAEATAAYEAHLKSERKAKRDAAAARKAAKAEAELAAV